MSQIILKMLIICGFAYLQSSTFKGNIFCSSGRLTMVFNLISIVLSGLSLFSCVHWQSFAIRTIFVIEKAVGAAEAKKRLKSWLLLSKRRCNITTPIISHIILTWREFVVCTQRLTRKVSETVVKKYCVSVSNRIVLQEVQPFSTPHIWSLW